eukprot:Skav217873  [mRNA]  locus=scaffold2487:119083:119658:+ [translate_table: standard]
MVAQRNVRSALQDVSSQTEWACAKTALEVVSVRWLQLPVRFVPLAMSAWLSQRVASHALLDASWSILQSLVAFVMQGLSALEGLTIALPAKLEASASRGRSSAKGAVRGSTVAMGLGHAQIALPVHTVVLVQLLVKPVLRVRGVQQEQRNVRSVRLENLWFCQAIRPVQPVRQAPLALEVHLSVSHVMLDL